MASHVDIEDIDGMRRRAGIVDGELRAAVRSLRCGDQVRLTFLGAARSKTAETLRVRVTRIRGDEFRGELADPPAARSLYGLHEGSAVAFTVCHIHSVVARPHAGADVSNGRPPTG